MQNRKSDNRLTILMIMKIKMIKNMTWLLATGLLLLTSCEQEEATSNPRTDKMIISTVSSSFVEVEPMGTRAGYADWLPDGYVPYNVLYPTTTPDHTTIGVFMTPDKRNSLGNFIYQGNDPITGMPTNDWASTIVVEEGTQYYLYGFMPREDAEAATIEPLPEDTDEDFAEGAILTIKNYNTLTAADVCTIVGLRLATEEETIEGPLSSVELGKFGYLGQEEGKNRVFILLKHLYAGLHFQASIDKDYHKLRDIMITKMEITATDIHPKGDLTVTLRANGTNTDPVVSSVFTPGPDTGDATITLFDLDPGMLVPENSPGITPVSLLSCFAPSTCHDFVLKTTYDVYDRYGNLIRKGCTAENQLSSSKLDALNLLSEGEMFTINLTIIPTYLYVLSDPDLDNPTIKVNI